MGKMNPGRKRAQGNGSKNLPRKSARKVSLKIYDDAIKTMANKLPQLFLGLVNYVFGTSYGPETEILRLSGEQKTRNGRVVMDVILSIDGILYQIECQSRPDGTMRLRLVEYAFAAALEKAWSTGATDVWLPRSCVLYLWNSREKETDLVTVIHDNDGGSCTFRSQIVKVQSLSAREMVDHGLWSLLPFYVIRYENRVKTATRRERLRREVLTEMGEMLKLFAHAAKKSGRELEFADICTLILDISNHVLRHDEPLRKAVEDALTGGKEMKLISERLREQEELIVKKDAQLADRDAQLADRDAQLADKDAQLADKDTQLADKDAIISEQVRINAELLRRLEELAAQQR